MSAGVVISLICAVLMPLSLIFGCVNEFIAMRLAKNPRCDKDRLVRIYTQADVGNVLAWLFMVAAYATFQNLGAGAAAYEDLFQTTMIWSLGILLVACIVFLRLRRNRADEYRGKKHFWEKK